LFKRPESYAYLCTNSWKYGAPAAIQTSTLVADYSYASVADNGLLVSFAATYLPKRSARAGFPYREKPVTIPTRNI